MIKHLQSFLQRLEKHATQPWFAWVAAFLALIDNFIFVIPIDAVLVAAVLAAPKYWIRYALATAIGNVAGAVAFAAIISHYGLGLVETMNPGLMQTPLWVSSEGWMHDYGSWSLLVLAILPVILHPIIALAAIAKLPLLQIAIALLSGRIVKYCVYSWTASHAPKVLKRFKGLKKEVEEIEEKPIDEMPAVKEISRQP